MRCSLESKALLVFFWVILKIFWVNWRLNWQSLALIWSQDWHSRGQRDWRATLLNLSDQGHDRVPGIWMESEFGLNPLMVYWWMTKFEIAKYRTFVDTYIWLMNIEHCAQSVRNVRVCCLVVRTRVCQMFPFTSYNPLGHHQSTTWIAMLTHSLRRLGKYLHLAKTHAKVWVKVFLLLSLQKFLKWWCNLNSFRHSFSGT